MSLQIRPRGVSRSPGKLAMPRRPSLAAMLLGLGAAALMSACAQTDVPRADTYRVSSQQKMRSIHHWDVLASDLAERLAPQLPTDKPLRLEFAGGNSAFDKGIQTLLLARLSDRGVHLGSSGEPLRLTMQTQVVRHAVPRPENGLRFTMLGLGIAVLRDLFKHAPASSDSLNVDLVGAGAIADAMRMLQQGPASGGPTGLELLVATRLQRGDLDLARTADIYYLERQDAALYQSGDGSLKTFGVVSQ